MFYEWMSEWGKKKGKREKEERKRTELLDAKFSKSKKTEYYVVEKF